jgi:hypothetical protein
VAWPAELVQHLRQKPICGYGSEASPATEPTALVALALQALDQPDAAENAAEALAKWQGPDGSVGVRPDEPQPIWPTSLAMLCWQQWPQKFAANLAAALTATLRARGKALEQSSELGHDATLVGWSWAENTHSWIEPTILHLLSLQAYGQGKHPRAREAIQLLVDRQLPGGGCNYGNTSVLGQMLRPHLQPSGMLLLAIGAEHDPSGRVTKSIEYVAQGVSAEATTASLCWGLIGLAAVDRRPAAADEWLLRAYKRVVDTDQSPHKFALLAHAYLGSKSPLITLPRAGKEAA